MLWCGKLFCRAVLTEFVALVLVLKLVIIVHKQNL